MELLGIVLLMAVAAVASTVYAAIARAIFLRVARLAVVARWISWAVLLLLAVELVIVSALGVLRSREIFGFSFLVAHAIALFLAPPALATVLLTSLSRHTSFYAAAAGATCLAIFQLFFNIHVSEVLYGIDGSGGPYGRPGWLCLPRVPPNKALQLTSHSVLQSPRGTVWRQTYALRTSRGGAVARS